MYIQEISIDIKSQVDKDMLWGEFSLLAKFYRDSGQTQGQIASQYISDDRIVYLPFTLEKDSLDKKYNNQYVNKHTKTVEELCNSIISTKTVGETHEGYTGPCTCEKPDYYILITNYLTIESPLTCGTCHRSVPLYRIPAYYDEGYVPILSWETNYISCDSLQMNCEVGERWALRQMQEIDSQLSKQGLEICGKIEDLTSIPTYYYLHNWKKRKGQQLLKPCPVCKGKWELETPLHNRYDFKCDNCRIISTVSPYF